MLFVSWPALALGRQVWQRIFCILGELVVTPFTLRGLLVTVDWRHVQGRAERRDLAYLWFRV